MAWLLGAVKIRKEGGGCQKFIYKVSQSEDLFHFVILDDMEMNISAVQTCWILSPI